MSNKPVYFDDLTLEDMFKYHDHTYMMSDDNRYYEKGRRERDIIEDKVEYIINHGLLQICFP